MLSLLTKTLIDLKEPAILIRLLIPFAAGMVLVSLLGYGLFGVVLTSDAVTQSPWVTELNAWRLEAEDSIQSIPVIGAFLLWVISMAAVIVAGVLGVLLGSYLVLIFAMIVVGFMTDTLVKVVHDKHYPHTAYTGHGSTIGVLGKVTKYTLLMALVFVLTLPIFFIPLVNVLWFWLLGFLYFRYMMVLDVGSVILPEPMFNELKSVTQFETSSVLMVLFLLSTLPFMAFLTPVLAVIALSHFYFDQLSLQPESEE